MSFITKICFKQFVQHSPYGGYKDHWNPGHREGGIFQRRAGFTSLFCVAMYENMGQITFLPIFKNSGVEKMDSVNKMLAIHLRTWDHQHPPEKPGMETCTCNPSSQEAETSTCQQRTKQPSYLHGWALGSVSILKNEESGRGRFTMPQTSDFHMFSCAHICEYINTCTAYIQILRYGTWQT